MKRLGRYTLLFERRPAILGHAAVCGKKEAAGPLARDFDQTFLDSYLNQESWEKAESMLQTEAANLAIRKAGLQKQDINMVFAGDLLNQCISSTFGLRGMDIPFLGQYGACSTMAQTLIMASIMVECGAANYACAVTSSHFCSAERQFRFPLEYGGQRTPTAQWTVTGSGACVVAGKDRPPYLRAATVGTVEDLGITDINNMGAAMAPEDVNLDPYIFRCAERCVLQKIRYYHNHSLVFPLERTETENRQSHLISYLTSSGILSAQMFFLSKHQR